MERSDRRRFLDIFRGRAVDARGFAGGIGYACFVWHFVHLWYSLETLAGIRGNFDRFDQWMQKVGLEQLRVERVVVKCFSILSMTVVV